MTKKYTLTTSEETVTEHPEDIIRLMKLAGLEKAQVVAEDGEWANTPDGSSGPNDKLDLDDYSKNSPESIAKQKKTIQPTLGDNPLEYSLDENEINEALTKEFDKTEEVTEELTAGQKKLPDGLQKAILAKQGKKDETEETKETSVEENLKEAEEQIKALKEDCSCGHGSSCDCGPDCGCGCNAVSENSYKENNMEDTNNDDWPREDTSERHVNGSQETEEIEAIIRPHWDELPEKLKLDIGMHFDSLKGEFDEAQDLGQSQERIKKLVNY